MATGESLAHLNCLIGRGRAVAERGRRRRALVPGEVGSLGMGLDRASRDASGRALIHGFIRELAEYEKLLTRSRPARPTSRRCCSAPRPAPSATSPSRTARPVRLRPVVLQPLDLHRPARDLSGGPLCPARGARPRRRQGAAGRAGAAVRRRGPDPPGMGGAELERAGDRLLRQPRRRGEDRMDRPSALGRGAGAGWPRVSRRLFQPVGLAQGGKQPGPEAGDDQRANAAEQGRADRPEEARPRRRSRTRPARWRRR